MAASSLTASFSSRQKNLTCGVCQEIYRSPRLLPCFHSFCLACIEGLANTHGRVFPCPVCRKPSQVPIGGARVFQNNFYITEEELQMARNNTEAALCPTHTTEPLIFLCTDCDRAICIRCKLLKPHSQHDCEDLSEASRRCKVQLTEGEIRLERTTSRLTKQLHLADDNTKAAQTKRIALKEQVQSQCDELVTRVYRLRDKALADIDSLADTLETQLKQGANAVQNELDSLMPLRQRLQHAMGDACDADVVLVEREMRVGIGSEAELARAEGGDRVTTVRPGLHCDVSSITDDIISNFIGSAVTLTTPSTRQVETISKIYRCGQDGSGREVHAICPLKNETIYLCFGGESPENEEASSILLHASYNTFTNFKSMTGKVTFVRYSDDHVCYTNRGPKNDLISFNSKCAAMTQLSKSLTEQRYRVSTDPFKHTFEINTSKPLTFDASKDEINFAVLEEDEMDPAHEDNMYHEHEAAVNVGEEGENEHVKEKEDDLEGAIETNSDQMQTERREPATTRRVRVYRSASADPVGVYNPPEAATFFPTDVCFWTMGGEEKLLVADWMNDAIHIVNIDDAGACHFERYLAAGHGDLVKPSALDTDCQGRLWIGCSNGWVLRCEEFEEDDTMHDITASDIDSTAVEVGSEPDVMHLESDQD